VLLVTRGAPRPETRRSDGLHYGDPFGPAELSTTVHELAELPLERWISEDFKWAWTGAREWRGRRPVSGPPRVFRIEKASPEVVTELRARGRSEAAGLGRARKRWTTVPVDGVARNAYVITSRGAFAIGFPLGGLRIARLAGRGVAPADLELSLVG
jgi:hypothetical protein